MSWIKEVAETRVRVCAALSLARAAPRIKQARQWLFAERPPITWAELRARPVPFTLPMPKTRAGRLPAVVVAVVLLLLLVLWYTSPQKDEKGALTYPHATLFNPIFGGLGALFLIYAAIRQARTASEQAETARKQAQIAADRHAAQTAADLQRRITESFSRAVGQLASAKIEERLGGIYTLERISQESADDYWIVMETLTAFVRERTLRNEAARTDTPQDQRIAMRSYFLWENAGQPEGRSEYFRAQALIQEKLGDPPATDIAAALTVFVRRRKDLRDLEATKGWLFDLSKAILRQADLREAHLERADFRDAHLEAAKLDAANLEGADLSMPHLEGAGLSKTNLKGAQLIGARLEGAMLTQAQLERATLIGANLKGAGLIHANLNRAGLPGARLDGANLLGSAA